MDVSSLFYVSSLSKIMSLLTIIIGIMVATFACNYLQGDSGQKSFYQNLFGLQATVLLLVHSDNLFLFSLFWLLSNLILVKMMRHKDVWQAAVYSANFVKKYLVAGSISLLMASIIVYIKTGIVQFTQLTTLFIVHDWYIHVALGLFLLTAMIQSAVMPVHGWLLNTLNAPTPVSACMHAGLINAGVLLLVRLAPLYLQSQLLLYVMFAVGVITATLGIAYKLIQPNVKRMLVCSTIAQMGFVFVQCGLGFFTAAVAHIFWHGLFKAYLFLTSATVEQEPDTNFMHLHGFMPVIAVMCGLLSAGSFVVVQGFENIFTTTVIGLALVAFVAGMQLALTILQSDIYADIFIACFSSVGLGVMYAVVDMVVHAPLHSLGAMQAQPLSLWYDIGLVLLLFPWMVMIGYSYLQSYGWFAKIYAYVYVYLVRITQPRRQACTLYRDHYKFR